MALTFSSVPQIARRSALFLKRHAVNRAVATFYLPKNRSAAPHDERLVVETSRNQAEPSFFGSLRTVAQILLEQPICLAKRRELTGRPGALLVVDEQFHEFAELARGLIQLGGNSLHIVQKVGLTI